MTLLFSSNSGKKNDFVKKLLKAAKVGDSAAVKDILENPRAAITSIAKGESLKNAVASRVPTKVEVVKALLVDQSVALRQEDIDGAFLMAATDAESILWTTEDFEVKRLLAPFVSEATLTPEAKKSLLEDVDGNDVFIENKKGDSSGCVCF